MDDGYSLHFSKISSAVTESIFYLNKRRYKSKNDLDYNNHGFFYLKLRIENLLLNMRLLTPFEFMTGVIAMIYFDRIMKQLSIKFLDTEFTFKLFVVSLILAMKFHQDTYSVSVLIQLSRVACNEVFYLESLFLELINYHLYIDNDESNKYFLHLQKMKIEDKTMMR